MFEKGERVRCVLTDPWAGVVANQKYIVVRFVYGQAPGFDRVVVKDAQGNLSTALADRFTKDTD